jgi:zinc protease
MASLIAWASPSAATVAEKTLSNGMRIVVQPRPGSGLVHVELRAPAGLRSQPIGQEGVAHVTAELLRHGTTTRDARAFSDELERTGGDLVAGVGRDYATLGGTFLARDVARVMELLSDAVRFPRFDEERMRSVVWWTRRQLGLNEQPAQVADAQVFLEAFAGHPYAHPNVGRHESLSALTRDQVVAFHVSRWAAAGSVLWVGGEVTADQVWTLAEEWFGGASGSSDSVPAPAPVAQRLRSRVVIVDRPIERAEIRIAWVTPGRGSSEEPALTIASALLGGAPSMRPGGERLRFGRELRVGYLSLKDAGLFTVSGSAPSGSVSEAVHFLMRDVRALHADANAATVDDVRRMMRQSRALTREGLAQAASAWHAEDYYGSSAGDSRLDAITPATCSAAARRWLDPDRAVIVVAGPATELEGPLARLGAIEVVRPSGTTPAATVAPTLMPPPTAAERARAGELLTQSIRAHGGLARLQGVRESKVSADVAMNVGAQRLQGTMTLMRREPDRMVLVSEIAGVASRQTLVGDRGWRIAGQDTQATDLDSAAVAGLKAGFRSQVPSLLLSGRDPKTLAYARGTEPWGDVDAFAVVVEAPGEPRRTLYVHPQSANLLGFDQDDEGTGVAVRRRFSDWRPVGGIQWPHYEERQIGGETLMTVRVRNVQINPGLADALFERP